MKVLLRFPTLTMVAMIVAIWLFLSAIVLVSFWPWSPRTPTQWVVFVLLGVPLVVGIQYLAERFLAPELGSKLSSRKFSWLRILYALAVILLLVAVLSAGSTLFATLVV